MPVTFEVDAVVPSEKRAATVPLRQVLGEYAFLGIDPELPVVDDQTMHPLIGAVHHAFVDHRPLVLSPDAIWLTIAQGVAQHVRLHAETLRPRLVTHCAKQLLELALPAMPTSAAQWGEAISKLRHALASGIGEGRARLLTCDFSTTGDAERIASEVVLMDVMSSYYDYSVSVICGIPRITLLGTPEDWKQIRARIDVIAELDLGGWATSLVRIAEQLASAAAGRADLEFFQRIYKPRDAYGWDRVTGWIARLYPYIRSSNGDFSEPNPLLAVPFDHVEPEADGYFNGVGIRTCDPPSGASRVLLRMRGNDPAELVTLEGGLLAIEQTALGELVPRAGFLVRLNHGVASVIERLRSEHGAIAGHTSDGSRWHHDARLRTLFEAIGSCTLQLGSLAWTLLPAANRTNVVIARDANQVFVATRVLDLGDRTVLAIAQHGHVIRLDCGRIVSIPPRDVICASSNSCELQTDERLELIPVVAASFIDFLATTLHEGVDLRSTTSLLDVSPDWWDSDYHAAPLLERLRQEAKVTNAGQGSSFFGIQELTVGADTWRRFEPPAEWSRGNHMRSIQIAESQLRANPIVDLRDGTLLASVVQSWTGRCIVRLDLAAIATKPTRKRAVHIESSQPLPTIPVLGRSLVDVLAYATDHHQLPRPFETLAEFDARTRSTSA